MTDLQGSRRIYMIAFFIPINVPDLIYLTWLYVRFSYQVDRKNRRGWCGNKRMEFHETSWETMHSNFHSCSPKYESSTTSHAQPLGALLDFKAQVLLGFWNYHLNNWYNCTAKQNQTPFEKWVKDLKKIFPKQDIQRKTSTKKWSPSVIKRISSEKESEVPLHNGNN